MPLRNTGVVTSPAATLAPPLLNAARTLLGSAAIGTLLLRRTEFSTARSVHPSGMSAAACMPTTGRAAPTARRYDGRCWSDCSAAILISSLDATSQMSTTPPGVAYEPSTLLRFITTGAVQVLAPVRE